MSATDMESDENEWSMMLLQPLPNLRTASATEASQPTLCTVANVPRSDAMDSWLSNADDIPQTCFDESMPISPTPAPGSESSLERSISLTGFPQRSECQGCTP